MGEPNSVSFLLVCACVVPVVVMGLLCSILLWFSYQMQRRVASHAWRMLQANLALSASPMAASLALKQEDTVQQEAAPQSNGHVMSEAQRQRAFIHG